MVTSKSIIEELVKEHGINSIAVPCPVCQRDGLNSYEKSGCPICHGAGKIQYGIYDAEFFS
jgi:DnaJ-class molecular chaperone